MLEYIFGIVACVTVAVVGIVAFWSWIRLDKEWTARDFENIFKKADDKRIEPLLKNLKDLGVIKSWYYNGTYHAE